MANLRLDIRDEALQPMKDGTVPIVPGNPDKSEIVRRVFAASASKRMPPQFAHKDLTEKQKQTIRQWVAEGAVYEGHWAYQPLKRPAVPQIAGVTNPIDAFIQERLVKEGIHPSPEADRRTLIRRVTLDLTGLPPAPGEVRAFENDRAPNAYERVVDRLLASPRYAEQQAMHWLDAVRYADTCGFHGDNIFPAWPYRDYVLRAFRDNMPFDRFTREQLAGDLIPQGTLDQKVASAYNRLNRTSAEGGVQPKEYLAKYGADRVRTVSVVWLGSTMGCSECHDHRFDPFKSKDFYSMKAFFADLEETGLVPDRGEKAWGTKLELPTPEQAQRRDQLDARIDALKQKLAAAPAPAPDQESAQEKELAARWKAGELAWHFQRPEEAHSLHGAVLTVYNEKPVDSLVYVQGANGAALHPDRQPGNGLIVASGPNPDNETYVVTLRPGAGAWTEIGLDVVDDESLPGSRISRGADRFLLTGVEAVLQEPGAPARNLAFFTALGDKTTDNGMPATAAIDNDPETGWGVALGESSDPFLALRFAGKVTTSAESRIVVTLRHDSTAYRRAVIGRFRLALSSGEFSWPADGTSAKRVKDKDPQADASSSGLSPDMRSGLGEEPAKRKPAQKSALREYFEWSSPATTPLRAELAALEGERTILNSQIARVVTAVAVAPQETRILPRGNWMDESGQIVEPAIPEFLGKLETGRRRANRLDLANWIVSDRNPLTARVMANRFWREFFGTGITKSVDDLGSQGEWPTHPELLDWLASEFKQDWDVKHLIRTIVTSHTYRQSSLPTPELLAKDPENRLFARQSRFRLDAENVRDVALEVSGLLQNRFGGPSVKPYQPDGYMATLNFPKREYSASRGADLYRRGVYTLWQRTFLHPSMLNFDAPSREECTVNRVTSNTPLQALDLLNDPIYVEAARVFAGNALSNGGANFDRQLNWIFHAALDRPPSKQERAILAGLYRDNLKRFAASPEDARKFISVGDSPVPERLKIPQLAAATTVTRAVLNLHETITRN